MKPNKANLNRFVNSISNRILSEHRRRIVDGPGFDTRARVFFAENLPQWFSEEYGKSLEESKEYIYVEGGHGVNPIPKDYRKHKFFASPICPDVAILLKQAKYGVAIELDHGKYGSDVRNALAKASFSVQLRIYDRADVFFLISSQSHKLRFRNIERETQRIINHYARFFNTHLHIM